MDYQESSEEPQRPRMLEANNVVPCTRDEIIKGHCCVRRDRQMHMRGTVRVRRTERDETKAKQTRTHPAPEPRY
jgi:hypothetical protein